MAGAAKHRWILRGAVAAALAAGLPRPAAGQVPFQGRVVDEDGAPLAEVDLNFYDPATGALVDPFPPDMPGQDDNTDVTGRFSMIVKPDVYDVRFAPPVLRTELAPILMRGIVVTSPATLDATLPRGSRLTGIVRGPGGSPVGGVDLDLAASDSGVRAVTVRDDTAPDGRFAVTVVRGVYDVLFEPLVGSGVAAKRVERVDLTSDNSLDVSLAQGFLLEGSVRDSFAAGLAGVDLDAEDRASGTAVPIPGDKTAFDGTFRIVLPQGEFDLFAVPVPELGLAPHALRGVVISSDGTLPPIVLSPGARVNGSVQAPDSSALAGANLDLYLEGTDRRVPLSAGSTDEEGRFALRVEPGAYDLLVQVPGSPLAPQWFRALVIAADTTLSLVLSPEAPSRVQVVSTVRDADGAAVAGALVRGTPAEAGEPWEGITALDGSLSAFVLPGTYRLDIEPPGGSDLLGRSIESVVVPDGVPAILVLERLPPPAPPRTALALLSHPSRVRTGIRLDLLEARSAASLEIFDLEGRRVATLLDGPLPAGLTEIVWDGATDGGGSADPGVYFLRFVSAGDDVRRKILRLP